MEQSVAPASSDDVLTYRAEPKISPAPSDAKTSFATFLSFMPRPIPHPGEKHLAATVYIVTPDEPKRVLMVHHKRFDKWLPPGGHVDFGENPYQAAIREVQEEAGIDIAAILPAPRDSGDHAFFLPMPAYLLEETVEPSGDEPAHFHIDHVYLVEVPQSDVMHDPNESHDIGWFTHEETLALPTFADVRMSLKEIFGK